MSFENYSCFMDNLQRFRGISFIICFPQRVFDKFSNVLSGYTDYRLRQPFFGGGSYVLFGDLVVVQSLSCVGLFATPWRAAHQASLPLSLGVCPNSRPLSWWRYLTISSSATSFSFCLQSFPASGSFPMSELFASGGQSIGASASASVLPMNVQGWSTLGLTGLISLQSKGLSRELSSTTVWKHQFFRAQLSLWSNSYIHTWPLENP